jgi:hypothetical protein
MPSHTTPAPVHGWFVPQAAAHTQSVMFDAGVVAEVVHWTATKPPEHALSDWHSPSFVGKSCDGYKQLAVVQNDVVLFESMQTLPFGQFSAPMQVDGVTQNPLRSHKPPRGQPDEAEQAPDSAGAARPMESIHAPLVTWQVCPVSQSEVVLHCAAHTPLVQTRLAHACEHEPQLLGSDVVSTHSVPQVATGHGAHLPF